MPYKGGIWTPDPVLERYGPELAVTASTLLKFYDELNEGQGRHLVVPVEQMLTALKLHDTPECRATLKKLVNKIGHKTGVGTRMEHGVVSVWFTAEVEDLIKTYQRLPGGAIR